MVSLGLVVLQADSTNAHVLITDETQTKGAILHIIPDDNPIAGKPATLFFDTQGGILNDTSEVVLTIMRKDTSESSTVETKRDGSLVTADYAFPAQGIYKLRYDIVSDATQYSFVQTTRISRGIIAEPVLASRYIWAEALLIACGVGTMLIAILVFNRRRLIMDQSSF